MVDFTEIRVRELTSYGTWPWRYVVEGLTDERTVKRWPWSREATKIIAPEWKQLRHGLRDYRPCDDYDASVLADHYRRQASTPDALKGDE